MSPARARSAGEAVAVAAVDADDVDLGVDDPVLADAELLVAAPLDRLVALPRPRRADFDDEVRCPGHVLAGEEFAGALVRDVEEVGLEP